MDKKVFRIKGMHCASCAKNIERSVGKIPGVHSARVDLLNRRMVVEGEGVPGGDVEKRVRDTGYEAVPEEDGRENRLSLKVKGMSSPHCAGVVRKVLEGFDGAGEINIDYPNERASFSFQGDSGELEKIKNEIEKSGYSVFEETEADRAEAEEKKIIGSAKKKAAWSLAISCALMGFMGARYFARAFPGQMFLEAALSAAVVYYLGRSVHLSAFRAAKKLYPNMDFLISAGDNTAFAFGIIAFFVDGIPVFFGVAGFIMSFHLLGRYLEAKARGKTSEALRKLIKLEAKTATVLAGGEEKKVPVSEVRVGDLMLVRPGEKIPTDGKVVEGSSAVDESMATGESMPAGKTAGDKVIGSTINREGVLKVEAEKVGGDTFFARVVKMVEEAQGSRIPVQEFADRVTSYFVPVVLAIALLTLTGWLLAGNPLAAVLSAMTVLIIACPCALGLATPTALTVGIGRGAARGILLRRGEAVELMGKTEIIVLDKTGTLTRGKPEVTDVIAAGGRNQQEDENRVLRLAASLEKNSEHPIAYAVLRAAEERKLEIPGAKDFTAVFGKGVAGSVEGKKLFLGGRRLMEENGIDVSALSGRAAGLEGQGKTTMFLAAEDEALGVIGAADTLKEKTGEAVAELRRMGYRLVMLTGDNKSTAEAIAEKIGIKEVIAGVLPDRKVEVIEELQESGRRKVAMAGDGINDAPSLTRANVGIAMGTGTDIAVEAGEITLVSGELDALVDAVKLSRATFKIIRQNLFWAYLYNSIAIPAAAAGVLATMLGPVVAAGAMALSSLTVVGNSLRLKKIKI